MRVSYIGCLNSELGGMIIPKQERFCCHFRYVRNVFCNQDLLEHVALVVICALRVFITYRYHRYYHYSFFIIILVITVIITFRDISSWFFRKCLWMLMLVKIITISSFLQLRTISSLHILSLSLMMFLRQFTLVVQIFFY